MNIMQRNIAFCILVLSLFISGCGPGQLFGPTQFVSISVGNVSGCALTTSGQVKCWGTNLQLMSDIHWIIEETGTAIGGSTLADVSGLPGEVSAITVGTAHACALTMGGGVKCWGWNLNGQLGDGTLRSRHIPEDVIGLTSGISAITAGYAHTCALTVSGGVKCWGDNQKGQLGDGTFLGRQTPVDVTGLTNGVKAISAGDENTCALTTVGGVKCWGENFSGQLGDGTDTIRQIPVDVIGLSSGVKAISTGASNTCALTSGGRVKCWGNNSEGAVGDGTTTSRWTPVDVIGLTSGVKAITVGTYSACALTSEDGVKCWGDNELGMLGDNSTTNRLSPVDVTGLTSGVSNIDAGITGWYCALTLVGRIKCWGSNYEGRLGDGTIINRLTPVDVIPSIPSPKLN